MASVSEDTITSILVTVGSTLFPALTDFVVSPSFLDKLSSLGVTRLVVQYGRANIRLPLGSSIDAKGRAQFTHGQIRLEVMRFTDDFEGLVRKSDAVISHAGSGSILTVLRAPRPLLVVPNTSLMDNHQAELADALGKDGYLTVSPVDDLEGNISVWLRRAASEAFKPFPKLEMDRFRSVLDETAGFEP